MRLATTLIFVFLTLSMAFAQDENETTKAPNFMLEDLNGDYVELNELLGEGPILISFWATWCKPCAEELAQFKKIYNEFKDDGLIMLGISTDNEKSIAKVKPYIKSKGYNFTVLLDTNSEVARKFYARAVPYTVVLDKHGNIVYQHLGYKKGDEIKVKNLIKKLIDS